MVQQEKLPSMFAGSTGVELKSERRIEKISMAYNGVLTPQTKITSLKLLKYPHKLGEFLILLNSVGGMGARVCGCMGSWVVWRVWVQKHEWCGSKFWYGWSGSQAFCSKIIIKSFTTFTGKHLCWSLL